MLLAFLIAAWSLLGSEERTEWRRSSLCLASCLFVALMVARKADVEEDLAERAACLEGAGVRERTGQPVEPGQLLGHLLGHVVCQDCQTASSYWGV